MADKEYTTSDVLSFAMAGDTQGMETAVADLLSDRAADILSNTYDDVEQELLGDEDSSGEELDDDVEDALSELEDEDLDDDEDDDEDEE